MMKISRNAPCRCGSGKKYKKCCLTQDEKTAPENRIQDAPVRVATSEIDDLSNKAVDLIEIGEREQLLETCRQLREQFPEYSDADMRLSQYYKACGDFRQAKIHMQAALQTAIDHPDVSCPEMIEGFREELEYLDRCINAGALVD